MSSTSTSPSSMALRSQFDDVEHDISGRILHNQFSWRSVPHIQSMQFDVARRTRLDGPLLRHCHSIQLSFNALRCTSAALCEEEIQNLMLSLSHNPLVSNSFVQCHNIYKMSISMFCPKWTWSNERIILQLHCTGCKNPIQNKYFSKHWNTVFLHDAQHILFDFEVSFCLTIVSTRLDW